MKIKVYIVTYKKNETLNECLRTLWNATKHHENIEVTVLANHPDVVIDKINKRKNLKVVINNTRMPYAWGNLAKDWNFCILDCFKNFENPDNVDWCVLAQNDTTWIDGWDEWLSQNNKFDIVTQPTGDQSVSLNINAVNKVGFFDERLTTLHFHEIDYFIRCILRLGNRASINDNHEMHNLSNCPIGNVITNTTHYGIQEDETLHNSKNWQESYDFISSKWGKDILEMDTKYVLEHTDELIKRNFEVNWYPFFWYPIKQTELSKQVFDSLYINEIIDSSDISVVVQGAINDSLTPICLESIRKYLPKAEIILSTWKDSNINGLDFDILVENEDPGAVKLDIVNNVTNNQNRQLISTRNGINKATRPYILKLRTDFEIKSTKFIEYFNKFNVRNNEYNIFRHRIIVSSVFSREFSCYNHRPVLFHPSDFFLFGLAEDIADYYKDIRLATDEELGNWQFLYPDRIPYPEAKYRYAPEQFFLLSYVKQFFPNIKFEDWTDWNEENIKFSNSILYNNFIFLDYKQSEIYSEKFIDLMQNPQSIYGLITFDKFQEHYRSNYDKNYKIEKEIIVNEPVKEIITIYPKGYTKYKNYSYKLKGHIDDFIRPVKSFFTWLYKPVNILGYIIKILFNIYYIKKICTCLIPTKNLRDKYRKFFNMNTKYEVIER